MTTGRRYPRFFWPARAGAAAGLVMLILGAACSETAAVEGGAVCTLGETLTCVTDAGCAGERTCLPTLADYGPCVCAPGDADVTDGPEASADGGT